MTMFKVGDRVRAVNYDDGGATGSEALNGRAGTVFCTSRCFIEVKLDKNVFGRPDYAAEDGLGHFLEDELIHSSTPAPQSTPVKPVFNVGERVVITGNSIGYSFGKRVIGSTAEVVNNGAKVVCVKFPKNVIMEDGEWSWCVSDLKHIDVQSVTPAKPKVRPMTALTHKILKHLIDRNSISPLEALVAYGTIRLAHQIYILRQNGYSVNTELYEDAVGHPYGRYTYIGFSSNVK